VLVLARSYPNNALPQLGLWTARPTALLAKHCDVHVISPVPWCPPLPALHGLAQYARFRRVHRKELRDGVDVEHPRFPVGPGTSLYPLEARAYEAGVRRTAERLNRDRPFDLIHAHFIYPDGVVASRLARRWGIPFVVTEHAPWTGWLDRLGISRQALPAARGSAAILAVSSAVEQTIRRYAGPEPRVEIVPMGVDTELFRPGPERDRKRDQILFVGFINYVKGIDVLLEAMARIAREGGPGRLLLVGGAFYRNTRLQEEELRGLAGSLDLGDRVSFLGRRPPEDVAALMRESAVVVLPSRAESFSAVLVEALASGTPVVATRSGGPEDIVRDGVGELVEPEDSAALADALARAVGSGDVDRDRLRSYAIENYDWNTIVRRTHELYEQVAAR